MVRGVGGVHSRFMAVLMVVFVVAVATGTAAAGVATADRSVSDRSIVAVDTSTANQDGAINVEVTDTNGIPIENADVTLYAGSVDPSNEIATAVADGGPDNNRARFTDLAVGTGGDEIDYVVRTSKDGFVSDNRQASLSETNTEETVFPQLSQAASIAGDVVDEDNQAVGGAEVTLSEVNSSGVFELASTTTTSDGAYSFTGVRTDNDYRVSATYTNAQGETFTGFNEDQLEDLPAGTTTADILLTERTADEPAGDSDFQLRGLSAPSRVTAGESFTASVFVKNEGDSEDTQTVSFRLDGATVTTQQLTLNAGERQRVDFTGLSVDTAGTYFYAAATDDDSQTATTTLTVEEPAGDSGLVAQYDANDDGEISADELGTAGEDFTQDEISATELGELGQIFASS